MFTNASKEQLEQTLASVNKKYNNNIIFNNFDEKKNKILFTLRVKNASGPGHRIGFDGKRKLINACWHVHKDFFEALFSIDDNIYVNALGEKLTNTSDFKDREIGSVMNPVQFSDACECLNEGKKSKKQILDEYIDKKVKYMLKETATSSLYSISSATSESGDIIGYVWAGSELDAIDKFYDREKNFKNDYDKSDITASRVSYQDTKGMIERNKRVLDAQLKQINNRS